MKGLRIKYSPFSLKLISPFQNSQNITEHRNGLILRLAGEDNRKFYGEVSPLPGFSHDDSESAELQLRKLSAAGITNAEFDSPEEIAEYAGSMNLTPSVRFGIEQVLLSRFILNYPHTFERRCNSEIKVNAVIGFGNAEDIKSRVNKYLTENFSTIKVKVGRPDFREDAAAVSMIREICGKELKIRLDANGAWNFNDAVSRVTELAKLNIEYIEEPCRGISELAKLFEITGVPIAADESVENISALKQLIESASVPFAVIKPSILGSPIEIMNLIAAAKENSVKPIISSAFESAVGKSMLVFLASLLNNEHAHGLNTSEFFSADICADPYGVENGRINFDIRNFPPDFKIENFS